jgi:uncharacterized protein YggE
MDIINISPEHKVKLYRILKIVLVVFIAIAIANCFIGFDRHGGYDNKQENTISLSGHGEISAVPDIANVNFTIRQEAKTVKEAQDKVAQIEKKTLDLLKTNNIADKDIKTQSVSFNPKYDYVYTTSTIPCTAYNCPSPGKSVITGYEAYESIAIKIRNTDDAGKIIQGLGTIGVTELNGPNFAVDNEEGLKAQARKLAINDAKIKAKELAKDLDIHLGEITSFSESGNYPMPMYDKAVMGAGVVSSASPAVLPTGENLITSDVTITYKIK